MAPLNTLTVLAALSLALVVAITTVQIESRPNPHALQARLLRKRQQATPPPDTTPAPSPAPSPTPAPAPAPPRPSPSPTNGGDGGQSSTPTALPQGLAPFQDATNLTAWQVLESHPSFTNVSSIALAHSPAVVRALNSTDPGTNLTVFAPYDLAFEALVTQPLFAFANSTDRYDALITQALAYHVSNATVPGTGAIYSNNIPPAPGNLTVPTLAGNLNVTLQRANERPAPPVQISQQTITIPTVQVPTATATIPSPTITPPVTVVRPTPTNTTTEPGQAATTTTGTQTQTATTTEPSQVGGPVPTQGEGVFANDAQIIYANLTLANGVLHVVDRLVSPLFIFNNPDLLSSVVPTALPTGTVTRTATR